MSIQVLVETATGRVLGYGTFSAEPADPAQSLELVDDDQRPALESAGDKYLETDGTVRVVPPAPPPIVYNDTATVDKTVRTADDQTTEVFRFPTALRHVYRALLQMTAIDATSGAVKDAEARMTFKRTGAGLVQVGATTQSYSAQDTAAGSWAIVPTVQGTDLVISVRGALGRTVDWLLVGTIAAYAPDGLG